MILLNVFDHICSISVDDFPICWQNLLLVCVISGFCREVDENCTFWILDPWRWDQAFVPIHG